MKALTKTTNCTLRARISGGARPKKFFPAALCAGPVPPSHFQIRSGATAMTMSPLFLNAKTFRATVFLLEQSFPSNLGRNHPTNEITLSRVRVRVFRRRNSTVKQMAKKQQKGDRNEKKRTPLVALERSFRFRCSDVISGGDGRLGAATVGSSSDAAIHAPDVHVGVRSERWDCKHLRGGRSSARVGLKQNRYQVRRQRSVLPAKAKQMRRSWRRGSVVRKSVFDWRTFPNL